MTILVARVTFKFAPVTLGYETCFPDFTIGSFIVNRLDRTTVKYVGIIWNFTSTKHFPCLSFRQSFYLYVSQTIRFPCSWVIWFDFFTKMYRICWYIYLCFRIMEVYIIVPIVIVRFNL